MKLKKRLVRDFSRFIPHYIAVTICLTISLTVTIIISGIALKNLNVLNVANTEPIKKEQIVRRGDEKLPSQYKIGKPYEKAIKDTTKPLVVEFYADWCPHCKRMTPVFKEVSKKMKDVNFSSVNSELNSKITALYNVDRYPYIVVIDTKTGNFEVLNITGESFNVDFLKNQLEEKIKK